MNYNLSEIVRIVDGALLNDSLVETIISGIAIDSRKLIISDNTLFFCIVGKHQDGTAYIHDLYSQGIRNFVVQKKIDNSTYPDANFIFVKDVLDALQRLATSHRQQFSIPVIGVTGSNGKTIVKEWLYQLLNENITIVRNPKSYNSQVGVPISVLQIDHQHRLGIFEAGISLPNEMERLANIIQPTIGVFNMLGVAHDEGFVNNEEKLLEKLKLFANTECIVYNSDDALVDAKIKTIFPQKELFTWSKSQAATIQVTEIKTGKSSCKIVFIYQQKSYSFTLNHTDDSSIHNALTCLTTVCAMGLKPIEFLKKMESFETIAMRLEMKSGINNCIIVNDSYNSDLTSLTIALDFLHQQASKKNKTVVLSDILQTGIDNSVLYRQVADILTNLKMSRVIGIGADIKILGEFIPNIDFHYFKTTNAFLEEIYNLNFQNEAILIKGARIFTFEKIAERLSLKAHKTVLEINLNALLHNYFTYKNRLKPTTKMMVMVKAGGYGNGGDEIAKLLEFNKVDYFGVAYTDEGIELRKAGVHTPIMVLNPDESSFDALVRYDLEPEIYSIEILKQFLAFLGTKTTCKIHIKLDTGMHRLGFEQKDLEELCLLLKNYKNIKIQSIFTHLASSEDSNSDDFTKSQYTQYMLMYSYITAALLCNPIRHILNSAGISKHADYQLDMVRLGIGIYGVDSGNTIQNQLHQVQTLKATISQIKTLQKGETVGYNRNGKITKTSRIATISIGYADGLLRAASNGNYAVSVHGKKAKTIGNIAMDMCMIDITDIPKAQVGDEVIIFGENMPIQNLAKVYNTISYEVLTNISSRVKRTYFLE